MPKALSKFTVAKDIIISLFKKKEIYGDILIFGNKVFILKTISVLDFLKAKDFKSYNLVNKFFTCVCLKNNFPYIHSNVKARACFVGKEVAYGSKEAYAASLAEEAYYIYLYEKIKKENPKMSRIQKEQWCNGLGKKQVLEYGLEVLKNLHASKGLIEYAEEKIRKLEL